MRSSAPYCARKGRYRLARNLKLVSEILIRYKRTLSDKCWTVSVSRSLLEEAVPVLRGNTCELKSACPKKKKKLKMEVTKSRELSLSLSTTLMSKAPSYQTQSQNQSCDPPVNITFVPRIIGPGKTPLARVVLRRGTN